MILFLWYGVLILLLIYCLKTTEGFSQGIQYIRIVNSTQTVPTYIQIGEVMAFDTNGINVAIGKQTSSSGDYPGTMASNAVDNNPNTAFYSANMPKSSDFWEVNLGKEHALARVEYYNRPDCCQERIIGCTMILLNKNKEIVEQFQFTNNERVQTFLLSSKRNTTGLAQGNMNENYTVNGVTTVGLLSANTTQIKGDLNVMGKQDVTGVTTLGETNIKGNANVGGDLFSRGIKVSGPNWTAYPDNSTTQSEISNDTNNFKQLMIVGNKSGGGERRVGIWDTLTAHGKLNVNGNMRANGSFVPKYTHTPYTDAGGNDITHLNESTHLACQKRCDSDPSCKGFNFWSASFPDGNGQCWIKNNVVNKTNTPHWHLFTKNF